MFWIFPLRFHIESITLLYCAFGECIVCTVCSFRTVRYVIRKSFLHGLLLLLLLLTIDDDHVRVCISILIYYQWQYCFN
jgi:hypothetical protein